MVYFKVLLDNKRPKADNIYPIVVRVTHNRGNTSFVTGIRVSANSWDSSAAKVKTSHPNAQAYNKTITDFHSRLQNSAYQLIHEGDFSFMKLKEQMSEGCIVATTIKPKSFNDFAQQLIDTFVELNKAGNAMVYKVAVKRFNLYVSNPKLQFKDIDYNLLEGFRRTLVKDGIKQNSISNYFRTLRAIYNKAIKAKLVNRSRYPFLAISIKTERTAKRAITVDELSSDMYISLHFRSSLLVNQSSRMALT